MTDPHGTGNAAQTRIIAEQLFEVWKAEQVREAKDSRRWWQSNAAGWATIVLAIGTLIATGKGVHDLADDANARSIRNETAIVNMRVSNSDRLARIETKLDRILEERSK